MQAESKEFLQTILETPSPSGFEFAVQEVVRQYVRDFADQVRTDVHGNVIACCNPGAPVRVMLAGHCDQIGLLVSYIDAEGFLYAQTIGGWDPQQLVGQRMTVWTKSGPVAAVIARKPIHLLTEEERKQVVKAKDLWLDIGAKNKEEADQVVRIGDPVTLKLGFQEMRNHLANSPGMDNKTGLWICVEALRRAAGRRESLAAAVYAVSTVQEEIGLRGAMTSAYSIDPHVGIGVDVTHATDCPTLDKKQEGDVAIGGGPVIYRGPNMNPVVVERMIAAAKANEIPYQLGALGRGSPTDANVLQTTRAGVAAALISTPNRYMHSAVELVSLDDLDRTADLLAEFVLAITPDADFTPRSF